MGSKLLLPLFMPTCTTKYHGDIEYSEDRVLTFPAGLIGFEEHTRFLLLENPATRPIVYLQSLSHPDLCFIALPAKVVDADYELDVSEEEAGLLELPTDGPAGPGDVLMLALITIQSVRPTTANLLAPIVVNMASRRGRQVLSANPDHSHRAPFLPVQETVACS